MAKRAKTSTDGGDAASPPAPSEAAGAEGAIQTGQLPEGVETEDVAELIDPILKGDELKLAIEQAAGNLPALLRPGFAALFVEPAYTGSAIVTALTDYALAKVGELLARVDELSDDVAVAKATAALDESSAPSAIIDAAVRRVLGPAFALKPIPREARDANPAAGLDAMDADQLEAEIASIGDPLAVLAPANAAVAAAREQLQSAYNAATRLIADARERHAQHHQHANRYALERLRLAKLALAAMRG